MPERGGLERAKENERGRREGRVERKGKGKRRRRKWDRVVVEGVPG